MESTKKMQQQVQNLSNIKFLVDISRSQKKKYSTKFNDSFSHSRPMSIFGDVSHFHFEACMCIKKYFLIVSVANYIHQRGRSEREKKSSD